MPITLAQADYSALFDEIESAQPLGSNLDDVIWKYPAALGQGFYRSIQLRDGLELAIAHYQLRDDLILQLPARPHPLEYSLLISGHCRNQIQSVQAGQYLMCSSGLASREQWEILAVQPIIEVNVHIEPELFCEFIGYPLDAATPTVQRIVGNLEQEYFGWTGMAAAPLQMVAQQILHCPYQGLTKRMYLESKVWELMALLIEQISEPQPSVGSFPIKADDIERIHHAKNILLQQMEQPPSLLELARQVGLNDCTLKRGFRQGNRRDYRR